MPRTRDDIHLSYEETNQPYIEPGTMFRLKEWKDGIYEKWNRPGKKFYDHFGKRWLEVGQVLMYLDYLGKGDSQSISKSKFWNLTTNCLVIVEGYHWWIEDEMEQWFPSLDKWK